MFRTNVPLRRCRTAALIALAACGLAAAPAQAQTDGSFPVTFKNDTDGRWKDSQIYLTGIGQTSPGKWAYLKPDGTAAPIDHTMADAPGHLTKNGRNFADMSFTLAEAGNVRIPPRLEGARIYVSVGAPMYFGIAPDDSGWAGPNLNDKGDPNYGTTFDWYELTYAYNQIPFGGNTTQVDQFGLPMTARLQQTSTGYDETRGITLSRKQVYDRFEDSVAKPFRDLAGPDRILAPRTSADFHDRGRYGDYLDPAIDKAWADWRDGFTLTRLHQTFTGKTVGNQLQFTQEGHQGSFKIRKPTSEEVFECSRALAPAGADPEEGVMGAELCAAFNRGVSSDTGDWWKASAYYPRNTLDNDYSGFFHTINMKHRSYGFAYDDINDQSSVTILPNSQPPSRLTIGVGW
jgi:hypothetical protein